MPVQRSFVRRGLALHRQPLGELRPPVGLRAHRPPNLQPERQLRAAAAELRADGAGRVGPNRWHLCAGEGARGQRTGHRTSTDTDNNGQGATSREHSRAGIATTVVRDGGAKEQGSRKTTAGSTAEPGMIATDRTGHRKLDLTQKYQSDLSPVRGCSPEGIQKLKNRGGGVFTRMKSSYT